MADARAASGISFLKLTPTARTAMLTDHARIAIKNEGLRSPGVTDTTPYFTVCPYLQPPTTHRNPHPAAQPTCRTLSLPP